MENTITPEEIARHYSAAMDSVDLLNAGQPEGMTDEDWADTVCHAMLPTWKSWWLKNSGLTKTSVHSQRLLQPIHKPKEKRNG
jgi:hypothetical protein